MIIVDFSQVMLSNIMMQIGNHTNAEIEESMCRHMVLNSIRSFKTKFGDEFGEIVVACDNKNYWRRQLFPYYKANRKKNQAASELNWKAIFECLNKVREELKLVFPYRVIDIESAEADDIIGTLCREFGDTNEKILILSGDKDFIQLQRYINVKQYDPVRKKYITHNNPDKFLKEHIIKGDSGDGVPNFLSPDNCLVVGERQKPITAKKLEVWVDQEPERFCTELMLRNYKRNEQLIDLSMIPEHISKSIMESFTNQKGKKANKLMDYFIANRLKNLMESIGDFA
jgi:hypothetical protein